MLLTDCKWIFMTVIPQSAPYRGIICRKIILKKKKSDLIPQAGGTKFCQEKMWLKITKVADCIVLHTTRASLGISGPWQHKTSKFPGERLQMGVADRAIVLKETVAHFWVLYLENSGAQGPPARFRSGRSCHPPGRDHRIFQTCDPASF